MSIPSNFKPITDPTIASYVLPDKEDFVYIVDVSDTTDSPAGTSKRGRQFQIVQSAGFAGVNNLAASATPSAINDSTQGYAIGSLWHYLGILYVCTDANVGAAVWAAIGNTNTGVQSVTGLDTDNTDPQNPVIQIAVDGITITGDGTTGNPLSAPQYGSAVQIVQDDGNGVVQVDNTNLQFPIIEFNGVFVDTNTISGNGTSASPLSGLALQILRNAISIDTNVKNINFLGPLTAVQTSAGNVTVGINNADIVAGIMLELMRFPMPDRDSRTVVYLASVNKLYVFNRITLRIFNATTGELLASLTVADLNGLSYISSLNEIWAKGSGANVVVVDPVANTGANLNVGLVANPIARIIEYLETGNNKVYFFYQAAVTTIAIRNLSTATNSTINWATTNTCFWAALCTNSSSAMFNHIVVARGTGFGIVNASTDTVVVNLMNDGFAASDTFWGIDYSPSLDVFIISNEVQQRVVYLQPATASTFTIIRTLHYLSKPTFVKIDETNGILLVLCNSTPIGQQTLAKIDLATGTPLGNILLSNVVITGQPGYMDIDPVNRFAYISAVNTTTANNTPVVKVKY
jgi:hypothetical protein